jgi:hypothetical protein
LNECGWLSAPTTKRFCIRGTEKKNYNKTPELIRAPRQPNRNKHFHMFQALVHNNNDFYIVQQKVDRTMLVGMEHMD